MATAESNIQDKIRKDKMISPKDLDNYLEIVDEKVSAEQIKLSSEEDLESILKLAEDLKEKVIKMNKAVLLSKYYKLVCLLAFVLSIIFIFLERSSSSDSAFEAFSNTSFKLSIVFAFLICFIIAEVFSQTKKKELSTEKLALKEVLQLLREVHGTIAEREDWSILKRAEFRIRLSRFDLSEKKDSVFNFFS